MSFCLVVTGEVNEKPCGSHHTFEYLVGPFDDRQGADGWLSENGFPPLSFSGLTCREQSGRVTNLQDSSAYAEKCVCAWLKEMSDPKETKIDWH